MRLVELSRSAHAGLRIKAERIEATAAGLHLIPIVVSEFRRAAIQYPIVFAKNPDTGRFAPYVLTGLTPEENIFWTGSELDVAYVPLNVRRQPFYVGTDNVLCVDLDSACLDESGERSLLDPGGADSAFLRGVLAILGELVAGQPLTEQFVTALLSLDLLAPLLLDIALDDGTPLKIQGLYGLDEDRLRQLSGAELAGLWSGGRLDMIYAGLLASGHIANLIRLKNRRIALGRAWHSND
jgi:SapC